MKRGALFAVLASSVGLCLAQQPLPADLAVQLAKARLGEPVYAWCSGQFIAGRDAYAIAVPSPAGGGRYLVLGPDGEIAILGAYADGADLACHTPAEAKDLNISISRTRTVHGAIKPIWDTTVVCGFVDNTHSVCWQHSPNARAFVKIGEWVT